MDRTGKRGGIDEWVVGQKSEEGLRVPEVRKGRVILLGRLRSRGRVGGIDKR